MGRHMPLLFSCSQRRPPHVPGPARAPNLGWALLRSTARQGRLFPISPESLLVFPGNTRWSPVGRIQNCLLPTLLVTPGLSPPSRCHSRPWLPPEQCSPPGWFHVELKSKAEPTSLLTKVTDFLTVTTPGQG